MHTRIYSLMRLHIYNCAYFTVFINIHLIHTQYTSEYTILRTGMCYTQNYICQGMKSNSYSVWASAGMIGRDSIWVSYSVHESAGMIGSGDVTLLLWLVTSRDSSYKEEYVLSIKLPKLRDHGDAPLRRALSVTVTPLLLGMMGNKSLLLMSLSKDRGRQTQKTPLTKMHMC